MKRNKRASLVRGQQAEEIAANWLQSKGYEIIARNYRCKGGEIDLIARDHETVVFIEVRSLSNATTEQALSSIGHKKQARLQFAAQHFLAYTMPEQIDIAIRFDFLGLGFGESGDIECQLLKGALGAF